jgi:hypothetical protein
MRVGGARGRMRVGGQLKWQGGRVLVSVTIDCRSMRDGKRECG